MPKKDLFLIEFSTEFILLNGIAITLLIPVINALTIVLNVLAIPLVIPENIFPPFEKRFNT